MNVARGIVSLLSVLVLAFASGPEASGIGSEAPRDSVPKGWYTYEEALALGIISAAEHARPRGMPDCPPLPVPFPSVPSDAVIPDNAPHCYLSPEASGVVIIPNSPLARGAVMPKN